MINSMLKDIIEKNIKLKKIKKLSKSTWVNLPYPQFRSCDYDNIIENK
jgi:hypothetical protein